jgi:hypothetical protein
MESKAAKIIKLILANGALGYMAWEQFTKEKYLFASIMVVGAILFSYMIVIAKRK